MGWADKWRSLAQGALAFLAAGGSCAMLDAAPVPQLSIQPRAEFDWHRIAGTAEASRVYTIEASSDLKAWQTIATLIDPSGLPPGTNAGFTFLDPASPLLASRFYRAASLAIAETNDWKNQISFPFDGFRSPDAGAQPRWVKFSVDLSDPFRVYYQDSQRYLFHYDFVVNRLERFRGMEREAFDAVSLRRTGQQILLGAMIFPPDIDRQEIGIQFVGLDPYPAPQVAEWLKLARSTIVGVPERVLYIPSSSNWRRQRLSARSSPRTE